MMLFNIYSDQLKPIHNDISFCMILAFVCYVSNEVVSFSDSILMHNIV